MSAKEIADPVSEINVPPPTPLVDVNLITYNHEKFIARAIDSVLQQETTFNYRVIIGDDCSTDNTYEIVRNYARLYPERIEVFQPSEHRGIANKDRVGIEVLRLNAAKYVALLDGDDYWTNSKKLQAQVDFLESHPGCSVCFHNAEMFYDDGSQPSTNLRPPDQKEISTIEDVLRGLVPLPCTVMFRNSLLGELPEAFYRITNADWMMFVILAEHGHIGYINEVMAAYRMHPGGIWSRLSAHQRLATHIKTYKTFDKHLNFKYHQLISEKIAQGKGHHGRSCLPQYHQVVKRGELKTAFRLLMEVVRYAPSEVLRPLSFAAVLKNGLVGILRSPSRKN